MKDLWDDCICFQYADDSNIYKHCKTTSIEQNIIKLEEALDEIYKWSKNNNLILKPDKTKFMTFITNKSKIRNTDFEFHPGNATTSTKTDSAKILGVHFQQQLNRNNHCGAVKDLIHNSFCTTKNEKEIAFFNTRKHLYESLVLSKFYCYSNAFDPLTIIQQRLPQKIQNSYATLIFN